MEPRPLTNHTDGIGAARAPLEPAGGTPAWRAGVDADRRKRPRRSSDGRGTVRRITAAVVVVATGVNAGLFLQTSIDWAGPGAVSASIVSFIGAFLPGDAGLRPSRPPSPAPSARPVVTTGGS